jgi:hypothetical protein
MVKTDFKNIGKVTVNGKRQTLYEHIHLAWYRLGRCQVQAKTRDEALAKFRECVKKQEADND